MRTPTCKAYMTSNPHCSDGSGHRNHRGILGKRTFWFSRGGGRPGSISTKRAGDAQPRRGSPRPWSSLWSAVFQGDPPGSKVTTETKERAGDVTANPIRGWNAGPWTGCLDGEHSRHTHVESLRAQTWCQIPTLGLLTPVIRWLASALVSSAVRCNSTSAGPPGRPWAWGDKASLDKIVTITPLSSPQQTPPHFRS